MGGDTGVFQLPDFDFGEMIPACITLELRSTAFIGGYSHIKF